MKLREIAYSRSGDKGDINNVCVFVYDPANWELLREKLTVDRVKQKFGPLVKGRIDRYEFPNARGLNFVMHEALEGGVSMSLRIDPHGKTWASLMLDIEVDAEM